MFRQILIDDRDRSLQQIVWRENPKETVKLFELNAVTWNEFCTLSCNTVSQTADRRRQQFTIDSEDDLQRLLHGRCP